MSGGRAGRDVRVVDFGGECQGWRAEGVLRREGKEEIECAALSFWL